MHHLERLKIALKWAAALAVVCALPLMFFLAWRGVNRAYVQLVASPQTVSTEGLGLQEIYELGLVELEHGDRAFGEKKEQFYQSAVEYFTRAIEADAEYADPYIGRSGAYVGLGESDLYFADTKRALEIGPSGVTYMNMAFAHKQRGQLEAALENYEKALSGFGTSDRALVTLVAYKKQYNIANFRRNRRVSDTLDFPYMANLLNEVLELRTQLGQPLDAELAKPNSY